MDRAFSSKQTIEKLSYLFPTAGISRVADLSDLDNTSKSCYVFSAIRPSAKSICVSMGKSLDRFDAKCGAIVEAIEVYFAEEATPELYHCTYSEVANENEVLKPGQNHTYRASFDNSYLQNWNYVVEYTSKRKVLCPNYVISLDSTKFDNTIVGSCSDGLASGNNFEEALAAGLLEQIERVSIKRKEKLEICPFHEINDLYEFDEEIIIRAFIYENEYKIPVVRVLLTTNSLTAVGLKFTGTAASYSVVSAYQKALEEAIQSKIGLISGARDDLSDQCLINTTSVKNNYELTPHERKHIPLDSTSWSIMLEQLVKRVHRIGHRVFTYEYFNHDFNIIKALIVDNENNIL